jgi:hypothetical protein
MKPTQSATKPCAMCGRVLPRTSFTVDPRMKSGLKSYCKDCCLIDARRRRAANPERVRAVANAARKRRYTSEWRREQGLKRYGLTLTEYDVLLTEQGGRCAICRTDTPGGRGNWHVDHCHDSGKVRALLCSRCNVGIGLLSHDPERLRAAADYIEHHEEKK